MANANRHAIRELVFICAFLTVAGCTSGQDARRSIQVQLANEPVSLDPALAEDGVSMRVLANTMDGLVGYDGGGELVQRLAERIDVQDGGRRYVFTLRAAKWSDGRPVAADDFVTGWLRALDPATASKMSENLLAIRGARAFRSREKGREQVGIRAEGGNLVVELERPASHFLKAISTSVALPVRQDVLDRFGGKWTREWPVTGPYTIASRKTERETVLEPNAAYWQGAPKHPVLFRIVVDESTGANLFENGKLDIMTRVPSLDFERFKKHPGFRVDPFHATYYLAFNVRKKPFDDREWRRAFAGAIDRTEVVRALGTGEAPAASWIAPGFEGHVPFEDPRPKFGDALATIRKRVARAKAPPIVIQYDGSTRNTLVQEKIQQDLKKALGIEVGLKQLDWKSHIRALTTDPETIYRFGWLSSYVDPMPSLGVFRSGSANNYTGWSSAEYDRLVDAVATLPSGPERVAKIREAQTLLVDREAVVVPIYHYIQTHVVSARVKGFRVNPFGVIRFDELSISAD